MVLLGCRMLVDFAHVPSETPITRAPEFFNHLYLLENQWAYPRALHGVFGHPHYDGNGEELGFHRNSPCNILMTNQLELTVHFPAITPRTPICASSAGPKTSK